MSVHILLAVSDFGQRSTRHMHLSLSVDHRRRYQAHEETNSL